MGPQSPFVTDKVYLCGAGRTNLAVNVFGGVTTCVASRKIVGNLLEQSFDEVWAALGGKVAARFPQGHPCEPVRSTVSVRGALPPSSR